MFQYSGLVVLEFLFQMPKIIGLRVKKILPCYAILIKVSCRISRKHQTSNIISSSPCGFEPVVGIKLRVTALTFSSDALTLSADFRAEALTFTSDALTRTL